MGASLLALAKPIYSMEILACMVFIFSQNLKKSIELRVNYNLSFISEREYQQSWSKCWKLKKKPYRF